MSQKVEGMTDAVSKECGVTRGRSISTGSEVVNSAASRTKGKETKETETRQRQPGQGKIQEREGKT